MRSASSEPIPQCNSASAVSASAVVPASGNLAVRGKQFWLGPARAGVTVTFWADHDVIHLSIAGTRVKTVRSHLSRTDLAALTATGGRPAGPHRCPRPNPGPRWKSTGSSPASAWSPWATANCSPRKSSAAAG